MLRPAVIDLKNQTALSLLTSFFGCLQPRHTYSNYCFYGQPRRKKGAEQAGTLTLIGELSRSAVEIAACGTCVSTKCKRRGFSRMNLRSQRTCWDPKARRDLPRIASCVANHQPCRLFDSKSSGWQAPKSGSNSWPPRVPRLCNTPAEPSCVESCWLLKGAESGRYEDFW